MLNILTPLHPKLVHFPIALLTTAFLFEVLSRLFKKDLLSQAAILIYCFAAVFTPVVVYSGLLEQARLHLHHPVLTHHKTFALLTMWISLVSLPVLGLFNKIFPKAFRNFFLILLSILVVTVTITAYYGGEMVYEYSVGVSS